MPSVTPERDENLPFSFFFSKNLSESMKVVKSPVVYLTPQPPLHPAERGRKRVVKSPLHRMGSYAQHTRDYRGEVNPADLS